MDRKVDVVVVTKDPNHKGGQLKRLIEFLKTSVLLRFLWIFWPSIALLFISFYWIHYVGNSESLFYSLGLRNWTVLLGIGWMLLLTTPLFQLAYIFIIGRGKEED